MEPPRSVGGEPRTIERATASRAWTAPHRRKRVEVTTSQRIGACAWASRRQSPARFGTAL
jgi:hypothetical protein